jgi:NADH-quinone oxidoreductase subunit F
VTVLPQAGDRRCACSARAASPNESATDEYRAHGGYAALRRAVELGPGSIIRELKDSKLQGRGVAASRLGGKWGMAVAHQPVRPHYLFATSTSRSLGTFKDRVCGARSVRAESERWTIAAFATGCERG